MGLLLVCGWECFIPTMESRSVVFDVGKAIDDGNLMGVVALGTREQSKHFVDDFLPCWLRVYGDDIDKMS